MKSQNPLRQKLINVMYLIFIAMAVLNSPVEFLEAFTDLNRSLERSNHRLDKENARIIQTIENLGGNNPRYLGIAQKLKLAKFYSDSTIKYIEDLKVDLITKSGGFSKFGHLVGGIDGTLPSRIYVRDGEATRLKGLLSFTKEQLMTLLDDPEKTLLDTVLITADSIPKAKGIFYNWEKYYFDNVPASAVVAILSKFQNDVRLAEALVIKNYYDNIQEGFNMEYQVSSTTKIDTFTLDKGVKKMDVFNIGEDGVARVTLPSSGGGNPSANAVIYTYDDNNNIIDSFQFNNGVGEIKLKTDQIGEFRMKGFIRFRYPEKKDDNKTQKDTKTLKEQPKEKAEDKKFEMEYKVVNPQPFISQKEYNVLFLGINNPLNVYHPEYKSDKYRVSINNGTTIKGEDGYYARVNNLGYATVILEVPDGKGGYKKVAEEVFKVKELPTPKVVLYNQIGGVMASRIFKLQKGLDIDAKNMEIENKFRVIEYTMTYINGNGLGIFSEPVKGSYFSGKSKELLELAQPGDIYVFDNIYIKGPDGKNKKVDPIVFKIN